MNTPTPRTDETRAAYVSYVNGRYIVDVGDVFDFAAQLERELTAAKLLAENNGKLAHNNAIEAMAYKKDRDDWARECGATKDERDNYKKACDQYSEDEMLCQLPEARKQRDTLAVALRKLRDCDFVITPHDRMDAVREIAREALTGANL